MCPESCNPLSICTVRYASRLGTTDYHRKQNGPGTLEADLVFEMHVNYLHLFKVYPEAKLFDSSEEGESGNWWEYVRFTHEQAPLASSAGTGE